jgi:hypothetical protein
MSKQVDAVIALLENGADVDAQDKVAWVVSAFLGDVESFL